MRTKKTPPDMHQEFADVRAALPELVPEGSQPLGIGSFGLVITAPDGQDGWGNVRKILFRHDNDTNNEFILDAMHREVDILHRLEKVDLQGIRIPSVVHDPKMLDDPDYMATYTMTRLSGATARYLPRGNERIVDHREKYRSAGAMLAKFHHVTRDVDFGNSLHEGIGPPREAGEIYHPDLFDARTQEKLAIVGRYLTAQARPGNMHGDYHPFNIMFEGNHATGLIDLSYAGRTTNRMIDARTVPKYFLRDFIAGYEAESGERLGHIVTATKLAIDTHSLSVVMRDCPGRRELVRDVKNHLDEIIPAIT